MYIGNDLIAGYNDLRELLQKILEVTVSEQSDADKLMQIENLLKEGAKPLNGNINVS